MSYKSLLTVLTGPANDHGVLDTAIDLARVLDAHLDVLAVGVDRTAMDAMAFSGVGIVGLAGPPDHAQTEVDALATSLRARLSPEDIRWSLDVALAPAVALGAAVAPRARYSDLLISPLPLAPQHGEDTETVVESALFAAHLPVLLLPQGAEMNLARLNLLIAWNGSDQAMRAVRAALPLLHAAHKIGIAVVAGSLAGPERSDPGGALAQMLSRRGLHANIAVLAQTGDAKADILLHHAREIGANCLVMGAYGHSRLRESLLGGATRDMMARASVPVLMAH